MGLVWSLWTLLGPIQVDPDDKSGKWGRNAVEKSGVVGGKEQALSLNKESLLNQLGRKVLMLYQPSGGVLCELKTCLL